MNIAALEAMLERGQDSAMLRFTLGKAYFDQQQAGTAEVHLRRALEIDPAYSAAWQWLTRCLLEQSRPAEALEVAEQGIEAAQQKGDQQVEKILKVLQKRARKALQQDAGQS